MAGLLQRLLGHPLAVGVDIDSAEAAITRAAIVRSKPFLRQLYEEWYAGIRDATAGTPAPVLELGSAGGFLNTVLPDSLRTDRIEHPGLDAVLDGRSLPFAERALGAIVMTNVFHHIPDVERFLGECTRCLVPGGKLVMWEPWVSAWSRLVYRHLHHEPFEPDAGTWRFPDLGPLSGANDALPWIVFARDHDEFRTRFPALSVERISPCMPFSYLCSGGVGFRSLLPAASYRAVRAVERRVERWSNTWSMFALIIVEKSSAPAT